MHTSLTAAFVLCSPRWLTHSAPSRFPVSQASSDSWSRPLVSVPSGCRSDVSVVLSILWCCFRLHLQDYDIKRAWPGCVIAEPYVSVRSLPYTRGQVRQRALCFDSLLPRCIFVAVLAVCFAVSPDTEVCPSFTGGEENGSHPLMVSILAPVAVAVCRPVHAVSACDRRHRSW